MDLERFGIYGHSGGGLASTDAILRYPDFYRSPSRHRAIGDDVHEHIANHDNRTYHAMPRTRRNT